MFTERWPDIVTPQPGGPADPLGESVLDPAQPWCRVFEPGDRRVVIGRHQDPTLECRIDAVRDDGVPIHRRVSGGGAVVLAPGMLVIALRLPPGRDLAADAWFARINAAVIPALRAAVGVTAVCRGHGDLALIDADGVARKILGTSLRQTSRGVYYLGVLLVADAVPLMQRYLAPPSRQPDYRAGRGHRAFCTCLGVHGGTVTSVRAAVVAACERLGREGGAPPTARGLSASCSG